MGFYSDYCQQLAPLFERARSKQLLLVTANERLGRFLQLEYSRYCSRGEAGRAFPSLPCLSRQAWLQQLWQQLAFAGQHAKSGFALLSAAQELQVWETIIDQHPHTPALLNLSSTAKAASDAWRLINEWQLDWPATQPTDLLQSHQLFIDWQRAFADWCRHNTRFSRSELELEICRALSQSLLKPPTQILLYGFDEIPPAFATLLAACKNAGTTVATFSEDKPTNGEPGVNAVRSEFTSPEQELEAVALWTREQLRQEPGRRIGIVVPDLSRRRPAVERAFNRVFEPEADYPEHSQHAPGFNISAGQPLAGVPVINTALLALQANQRRLQLEQWSTLLLSPFIGKEHELCARAALDVYLREQGELEPSRQLLKTCASQQLDAEGEPLCADFYHRIDNFDTLAKNIAGTKRLPSEWIPLWLEQLQTLAWPGTRTLDTLEYQQIQAWQTVLENLVAMDAIIGEVSISDALSALRKLLQQHSFQAQTHSSPVQILGVLEAAGLPFDKLWVLGLDDETWPPAPSPNPLLPLPLQVKNHTPQSSAEREYRYAQQFTQRLRASAGEVIFSHAQLQDDKQLSPSPLIQQWPLDSREMPLEPGLAEQQFTCRTLESFTDACGPAVATPEKLRGGSSILRDQAACPFQAFTRHRLQSAEIPEPGIGLDAAERGTLLHEVMEILWRKLGNQQTLLSSSDEQLRAIIDSAIERALLAIRNKQFVGYRFVQLESARLREGVFAWLQLEKQRPPFQVAFNESEQSLNLAGLPLRLRYDRIDQLEDGSLLVLDYKTGTTSLSSWQGERLDEPQVPLYAIANKQRVSGAAFGQINNREVAFKGIAEDSRIAPGLSDAGNLPRLDLPDNWQDILGHWQHSLEQLASDFLTGKAAVDPKQAATCQYCELHGLCRIGSTGEEDGGNEL